MVQREWVEKDFYKELGVSSDASDERDQAGRPQVAWPRTTPTATRTTRRPRSGTRRSARPRTSCSDKAKRKEYDETRRLFANGGGRRFNGGGWRRQLRRIRRRRRRIQPRRPVRRGPADRWRQHRRPVRWAVRSRRTTAAAQPSAPRQRPGDRDRTVVPRGHQGRGDAAAAHQPGAVHQLPRQRRAPGHQPEGVPELQRRGRHQPQPGRVRLLRAVHRMPGQRLDHRGAVRRVPRHRRDHPHPHHQRADPTRRRGRSAHPAGRPGRGGSARRTVGRPVRHRARAARQGVRPRRRRPDRDAFPSASTNSPWAQRFPCRRWRARSVSGCPRAPPTAGSCGCAAAACPSVRAATATCWSPSRSRFRRTSRVRRPRRWRPTPRPSGPAGSTRGPDGRVRDEPASEAATTPGRS